MLFCGVSLLNNRTLRENYLTCLKNAISNRIVNALKKPLNEDFPLHYHDCCEIEIVLSGEGSQVINGIERQIKKGDLYLLTPYDCHEYKIEKPLEIYGVMFDEHLISPDLYKRILLVKSLGKLVYRNFDGQKFTMLKYYFEQIIEEENSARQSSKNVFLSETKISRIIDCIIIELLKEIDEVEAADKTYIYNAVSYVYQHFSEPISLSCVAKHLNLSEPYTSRLFKFNIGRTFKELVIDLRMMYAQRLLADTDLMISQICYNCGFSSYPNFERAFKKKYNMTPEQWRSK